MATERKAEKYHSLSSDHIFQPIAMENLGSFSSSSLEFLREVGRRLGSFSGEEREACFLFQRLSDASMMTFRTSDHFSCFILFVLTLGHYTFDGIVKNNNT